MIDNAYYFSAIQKIGGIETFLYQLVKSNQDKNVVIYYKSCDINQLRRLNKYCTMLKYEKGTKIKAKRVFFNFNLDPLENGDVTADRKILVVHGNYKWLSGNPPMHDQIDEVYAVSKDSANAYEELTGIPCKVVYNPLSIDNKKCLMLMSATRIDTTTENIKGGSRMIALADALDNYCKEHDVSYQWHVYSNQDKVSHDSIQILKPTLDIACYMPKYDYVIQLSDNVEGFNYTINESLIRGIPIVATQCDVYKECGVTKDMAIWLDFDLKNIGSVVEDMFTRTFNFTYKPPKSNWGNLLVKGTKKDIEKVNMIKVRATQEGIDKGIQIGELGRVAKPNEEFEVAEDRLATLLGDNPYKIRFVEVIPQEKKEEKKKARKE